MTPSAVDTLVRSRIGLDPRSLGESTLERVVEGRMRASGVISQNAYAGLLSTDPTEWTALVGELVVPESWFFRGGRSSFEFLANWIRERVSGRVCGKPVRVLSVPCSTGEEPYSLAIALETEGIPAASCQIDGVELSPAHLLRAVTGRYTSFSFREAGSDPRPVWFTEVDAGRWEVRPRVRDRVRFRPGNVVAPDFLADEPPYDLILCRNLFIYLTPEGRARALANLDRLLAHDGLLCLTPTEADRLPAARFVPAGPVALAGFRKVHPAHADPLPRSGVLAFPRREPAMTKTPPRSGTLLFPGRTLIASQPGAGTSPTPGDQRPSIASLPQPSPASTSGGAKSTPDRLPAADDPVLAGRTLADAGRLAEARVVCETAARRTGPTATLYGLLGVINLAEGRTDEASEAFRKALYLDPDHVETLTHMIGLCERRGDRVQAEGIRRKLARMSREATT